MTILDIMGRRAKEASRQLACASTSVKNAALMAIADALIEKETAILSGNAVDFDKACENGMSQSMLDRLCLSHDRIAAMADGVRQVAAFEDPVGQVISGGNRPNGLKIEKVRVPLGVIGIIFESRPNVTSDAAALCLKAGNAVILRGGKEAINSNKAIVSVMREAVEKVGLSPDCIQIIEDTTHETAAQFMRLNRYLDVLIPRGGASLINSVLENSTVPVIQTGVGNCHMYIDASADVKMAVELVDNAKTSRPSVCNAIETLLVHKDIAQELLPLVKERLDEKHTEIRGCDKTAAILGNSVVPVAVEDYEKEFNDYIIACRVVSDIDEALEHISDFSTGHSEAIVTSDYSMAEKFVNEVDAAAVYVNASTRFTDGGEFGLGAEIGISTQKLHARGPMGITELTSCKYIIRGSGQIR